MKVARVLLSMLRDYGVRYVFGLPGETTLPWYEEWRSFEGVEHVLVRDERTSAFMADGYAKVSGRVGVCESPSPGATHLLPGVTEAFKSGVPMLAFTSDIPLADESRNMLTGMDQSSLFRGVVKATFTLTDPNEVPHAIRRAFRIAVSGKPGPVHIRIPQNLFDQECSADPYVQAEYGACPALRSLPEVKALEGALDLLSAAERPVLVCGQGVLTSRASDAVRDLAELLSLPVGTTINGKGALEEIHPLSLGVIGARGGTSFSNGVLGEADCVLFVGCSTDSAGTAGWTLPKSDGSVRAIQIDLAPEELGNTYPVEAPLLGDARATLEALAKRRDAYRESLSACRCTETTPIHPLSFVDALERFAPEDALYVVDPGVSAIYPSAFLRLKRAGRSFLCNYAVGALGYGLPAALGASYAAPERPLICLSGDGSFGFYAGELETLARTGRRIKLFLFDNGSFGWIRATNLFSHGGGNFATDFGAVDHLAVARGFGIPGDRIEGPADLDRAVRAALAAEGPFFVEVKVRPEDELIPPVPGWSVKAGRMGLECTY
jgi:acetolactate synthase-1/2/3 large subunit